MARDGFKAISLALMRFRSAALSCGIGTGKRERARRAKCVAPREMEAGRGAKGIWRQERRKLDY